VAAVAALAAAGALALSGPALADPAPTTLYVSGGGANTEGCGGIDQKCQTIQFAIDKARSGDTVQVSAGEYDEVVTIAKGITLQGAGSGEGGSIINGTDVSPGPNGLVDVLATNGNVTISGFTIENPSVGTVSGPYTISLSDPTAADHITITGNTILGWAADPVLSSDSQVGIVSANTAAGMTITNNDISGVWQGMLLEGDLGAVDVSGNHLHNLTPYVDGDTKFPAEGVYILSDKQNSASDQDVTNNFFDHYNGIGIAYSAGYNLGGCCESPCEVSACGAIR
jgi:hypothetical protein